MIDVVVVHNVAGVILIVAVVVVAVRIVVVAAVVPALIIDEFHIIDAILTAVQAPKTEGRTFR